MTTIDLEYKNYYVEGIYMNANVQTGVLTNRSGRRMLALTNDFLIGLHRALEQECGGKAGDVLQRCGKRWGKNFGKGLDDEWSNFYGQPASQFPLSLFQNLLMQEFSHNGWGNLTIDYSQIAAGVIEISLVGAIMADISSEESDYPADELTSGILAGLFTHFLAHDVDCLQSQCARRTPPESRFLISEPSRIQAVRATRVTSSMHDQLLQQLLAG